MKLFITYALVWGLIGGGFVGTLLSFRTDKILGKILYVLASIVIAGTVLGGGMFLTDKVNEERWNDGICSNCGGYYEFVNGSHARYNTRYYYKCGTCKHIIQLTELF